MLAPAFAGHEIDYFLQTALAKARRFFSTSRRSSRGSDASSTFEAALVLHFDQEGAHARLAALAALMPAE